MIGAERGTHPSRSGRHRAHHRRTPCASRVVTLPVQITLPDLSRKAPTAPGGRGADWVTLNSRAKGRIRRARSQIFTDESRRSSVSSQVTGVGVSNEGEFGANEWLVEELYEQFKIDRNSVDKAWGPLLETYHPVDEAAPAAPAET